jgi:hypothetical protein
MFGQCAPDSHKATHAHSGPGSAQNGLPTTASDWASYARAHTPCREAQPPICHTTNTIQPVIVLHMT